MTSQNRKILIFLTKLTSYTKIYQDSLTLFWAPMTLLLMLVNVYEHYV